MDKELPIFTAALDLTSPWFVRSVSFEQRGEGKVLHVEVDHEAGSRFDYEHDSYPVYDHQDRQWRHLDFFQHTCYLHARVPRVKTKAGKVRLVEVPWAQPGSSFTLLFEANVMALLRAGLSASAVGRQLHIGDKRVFGLARRRVSQALAEQPLDQIKALSVDETSVRKGHHYFTIFGDREAGKVVGVSTGKDQDGFDHALIDMEVRGADRHNVTTVTMDMSAAYIAGVSQAMPEADIVFDRFHLAKMLNEAVDQIRRQEQKSFKELTNSRYLWLRNAADLGSEQTQRVEALSAAYPSLGQAYRLKELFRDVLDDASRSEQLGLLEDWIEQAWQSGLAPVQKFVNTLQTHWYGIETYFRHRSSNAFAERVNLKIQDIKRTAKGYRNPHNFVMMIYFHLGGLDLTTHSI